MMGMPELIDDPRFSTLTAQIQPGHRDEFLVIFLPWSMEHTKMECIKLGQQAGVLCGPLYNMEELLNDPHFHSRNFWTEIVHPVAGRLTYPGRPINAEKMPWIIRRSAPLLGEHNNKIYCDLLGYSHKDLARMKQENII
jgi:crotonobetainyl-CoA:carnitine CoA-transferase CaiB-like acyl-CoA transferase